MQYYTKRLNEDGSDNTEIDEDGIDHNRNYDLIDINDGIDRTDVPLYTQTFYPDYEQYFFVQSGLTLEQAITREDWHKKR